MSDFPETLLNGYNDFKSGRFDRERQRYQVLADQGQTPETIFDSTPGEMFVVRNVANLVPPYEPDGT